MARLVDLSHPIEHGMITYPGLPGPVISDFLGREASRGHYAGGTTFHIARVRMVGNTGTYVDAPFHRYAEGPDVAALPLDRLANLEGVVVDVAGAGRGIDADRFVGRDVAGKAVLVRTGWDAHWRTPRYGDGHPFLTRSSAEHLAGARPALVGIDSLNVDDTADGVRPAHTLLLAAGIPVVEHLCHLDALPESGFHFHCVPAPFRGLGSFPVRAYAVLA
ncbi:MAG TPA: cyclase family protein [Thermoanaerobaculia bacterium]|jgi:kynurenine formamidase|nr:cyclase family protein [Thermoanaerobaculia bacterium]